MKVILLQDIKGTGKKGEIIKVAEGFARNHLLPKKLAVEASEGNLNDLKHQKANLERKKAEELSAAKELKARLNEKTVTLAVKMGEGGRLFGSINTKDIAERIEQEHGILIDKRKIELQGPIKAIGTHPVNIKLHPEVTVKIQVQVIAKE